MPVLPKKRVRARRAHARQRERRGFDLRPAYRKSDLPDPGHLAVVEVDNPLGGEIGYVDRSGNLELSARLEPVVHRDGTTAPAGGAPEWTPPSRPRVAAIRNLRGDVIGRIHAKRQCSEVQYAAARRYQELIEKSTGTLRSLDWERPVIDCAPPVREVPAFRLAAAKQLRALEAELTRWYGNVGLGVVRLVLVDCNSLQATARGWFGAKSEHQIRAVTWLFRRSLDCLAVTLRLASSARPPPRPARLNGGDGGPDLQDPRMHADTAELGDPALRRGRRPNGKADA